MSHDKYAELERRVSDMEELMQGNLKDGPDGAGGVFGILKNISETLYGSRESGKRGMVEAVDKMTKIMYVGMGVGGTVNIAWIIFAHFHK